MQTIVQYGQALRGSAAAQHTSTAAAYLEYMAPVLALVVEAFIEHLHDLDKVVPGESLMLEPLHRRTTH